MSIPLPSPPPPPSDAVGVIPPKFHDLNFESPDELCVFYNVYESIPRSCQRPHISTHSDSNNQTAVSMINRCVDAPLYLGFW